MALLTENVCAAETNAQAAFAVAAYLHFGLFAREIPIVRRVFRVETPIRVRRFVKTIQLVLRVRFRRPVNAVPRRFQAVFVATESRRRFRVHPLRRVRAMEIVLRVFFAVKTRVRPRLAKPIRIVRRDKPVSTRIRVQLNAGPRIRRRVPRLRIVLRVRCAVLLPANSLCALRMRRVARVSNAWIKASVPRIAPRFPSCR